MLAAPIGIAAIVWSTIVFRRREIPSGANRPSTDRDRETSRNDGGQTPRASQIVLEKAPVAKEERQNWQYINAVPSTPSAPFVNEWEDDEENEDEYNDRLENEDWDDEDDEEEDWDDE